MKTPEEVKQWLEEQIQGGGVPVETYFEDESPGLVFQRLDWGTIRSWSVAWLADEDQTEEQCVEEFRAKWVRVLDDVIGQFEAFRAVITGGPRSRCRPGPITSTMSIYSGVGMGA